MHAKPSTMFALGLVLSSVIAAVVLARPEPVPANLAPPPRSALAKKVPQPANNEDEDESKVALGAHAGDEASEPAPEEAPPPKGYALTRQDLDTGLAKVHARAMACRSEGAPPVVQVHIVISPSGSVSSVGLPAELRGSRAGDCISHALHAMSFPAWHALPNVPNVEWNYPLRFDTGE